MYMRSEWTSKMEDANEINFSLVTNKKKTPKLKMNQ